MRGPDLPEQRQRLGIEPNERLVPFPVVNRDGSPAEFRPDTGGKRFRHRLLRGPTGGIILVRVFERTAVSLLFLGEHPFDEVVAVPAQRRMDAFDFDNIATKSDQNAAGGKGNIQNAPGIPVVLVILIFLVLSIPIPEKENEYEKENDYCMIINRRSERTCSLLAARYWPPYFFPAFIRAFISRTDSSMPLKSARLTML
jgi:hypothetical protein